jgi:hypothetical protein
MIELSLQAQVARLRQIAEDYKDRALEEIRQKVVALGVTLGLAIVGFAFLLIAVMIGLAALCLWVAQQYGPFAGLGTAGGLAVAVALIVFAIIAFRGGGAKPAKAVPLSGAVFARQQPSPPAPQGPLAAAARSTLRAAGDVAEQAKETIEAVERAGAATRKAADTAADLVRNGPRQAMLATLAASVVLGVMLGRRR